MKKYFSIWNSKKIKLENINKKFLFKERDIWWISVGVNIASESCGKGKDFCRPVIILKKLSKTSFIGLPLTTKKKKGSWFCSINMKNEERYVLLYQIRMFSTNRLQRHFGIVNYDDFIKIKKNLKNLLEIL